MHRGSPDDQVVFRGTPRSDPPVDDPTRETLWRPSRSPNAERSRHARPTPWLLIPFSSADPPKRLVSRAAVHDAECTIERLPHVGSYVYHVLRRKPVHRDEARDTLDKTQ